MSRVKGIRQGAGRAQTVQPGVKRAAAMSTYAIDVWAVLAFLYPLTQLVVFEVVGQLYLIDLISLPMLAVLLTLPDSIERLRRIAPIMILLGIWLAGQVVTDLVRQSDPNDFLRGWAKITLFAIQLATLWIWLPRRRVYFAAFAVGLGIATVYSVPEEFIGYQWKFGWGKALVLIILGCLIFAAKAFPRVRYAGPAILLLLSLFLLLQAARSAFGVLFIAAIIVAAALLFTNIESLRRRVSGRLFAMMLLGGVAVASGATTIYGYAAESGTLGRDALVKYRDQTSGEVPLLLGGRSESFVSVQAIVDSPVIGHGSWARDPYYVGLHHATKVQLGLPIFDAERGKRDLIPSHSYLLGAWVESGVAGGLFWLWVLTLPFLATYSLLKRDEILATLIAYSAIDLLWSVLFSPFGSTERISVAFQLALLCWSIRAGGRKITLFAPVREALVRRSPQAAEA